MSAKLKKFADRLDATEIAAGMNAAKRNAHSLIKEAQLLLDAGYFARATALAILSIEESGKTSILRSLAVARSEREVQAAWKNYRSHTKKNAMWIFPSLVADGARALEDFRPLFDESGGHADELDSLKQVAFYTDCLGNKRWSQPLDAVGDDLANILISIAKMLAAEGETTAIEIELWIEHIGPVWMTSIAWMKKALVDWSEAMRERGFEVGDMASFVGLGR